MEVRMAALRVTALVTARDAMFLWNNLTDSPKP